MLENRKIFEKVKLKNISWVIVLVFETVEDANNFAETENLQKKIQAGQTSAVLRIED